MNYDNVVKIEKQAEIGYGKRKKRDQLAGITIAKRLKLI